MNTSLHPETYVGQDPEDPHERSILPEELQSQPANPQASCLMPDPRRKRKRSEHNDGDGDQGDDDQGELDGDQGQDYMCPPSVSEKRRKDPRLTILLHPLHSGVQKRKNGQ